MDTELLYAASNGRAEPGYCNVTNIDSIYIVPCKGWMLLSSIALTTISLQPLEWLITKTMKIWNFIPTKTVIKTDSTVCHFHVYQNVCVRTFVPWALDHLLLRNRSIMLHSLSTGPSLSPIYFIIISLLRSNNAFPSISWNTQTVSTHYTIFIPEIYIPS